VGGPLVIDQVQPVPNPASGGSCAFYVRLQGPAQALELSVYTPAMNLVATRRMSGAWAPGWNRWPLDLSGLPAGLYFTVLRAHRDGATSLPGPPGRLMLLR
jgi:hypothetical protein